MSTSVRDRMRKCRQKRMAAGVCTQCGKHKPFRGQLCRVCLDKRKVWYKQSDYRQRHASIRISDKKVVLEHYGGKCACCCEDEPCFLAVDHINGNGNSHRKQIGKWGSGFFKWLITNQFPDGFQLLCHNCNMGKHLNNGICPHKARISQGILR